MADLSAMYMDLAENARNAPYQGMLRAQQFMENQLAYQKAREDLEAQRGLRALFAQNPNATPEEVSRFSPQFGMEMTKAQLENQERVGRMTKTQREISELEAKAVAETIGPIAERAKMTGDIGTYNMEMGKALSSLAQQGIPLPMNFDPKVHTPDRVLMNSVGRGYRSPWIENQMAIQKEEMLSGVPQRPSYSDIAGRSEYGPYGPRQIPPVPPPARMRKGTGMGGAPAAQLPEGYERATAEDIPAIQQAYDNATDLNEKQQIGALLNQLKQQTQPAGSQFVTPQQESQLRMEEERQKKELETAAAGQRKSAELGAESAEETAKKAATMAVLPPDEEVYGLIKKSLAGQIEKGIKGSAASEQLGIGTEANTATAELVSIQEQLRGVVKALYTPGAITKDEQEKMETAIGAIAQAKDPDSRIAGYRRFMDMARKSIVNHPELASEVERITGSKILSPRRKLSIGDTVGTGAGAMRYKGGNPNSPDSWEGVR